ncbi:hypothetical protein V8E55_008830 [Tylopilus felleus]
MHMIEETRKVAPTLKSSTSAKLQQSAGVEMLASSSVQHGGAHEGNQVGMFEELSHQRNPILVTAIEIPQFNPCHRSIGIVVPFLNHTAFRTPLFGSCHYDVLSLVLPPWARWEEDAGYHTKLGRIGLRETEARSGLTIQLALVTYLKATWLTMACVPRASLLPVQVLVGRTSDNGHVPLSWLPTHRGPESATPTALTSDRLRGNTMYICVIIVMFVLMGVRVIWLFSKGETTTRRIPVLKSIRLLQGRAATSLKPGSRD